MDVLLGFDPGGQGALGWAAVELRPELPLRVLRTGTGDTPAAAVRQALQATSVPARAVSAAIDAPMFWGVTAGRQADVTVRRLIERCGCSTASGTVQHVNSLRGACLIGGILVGHLLRLTDPTIHITETHPKALFWALGIASSGIPANTITGEHLSRFLTFSSKANNEHERDAAVGTLSGWAAHTRQSTWHDLFAAEPSSCLSPLGEHVSYWFPKAGANAA